MSIEFSFVRATCFLAQTTGSTAPTEAGQLVFVGALTLAALGVAWALGAFNPRSINGPVRLTKDDSWTAMLLVLGITVLTWAVAPLIYSTATGMDVYETPASQPTTDTSTIVVPTAPTPVTPPVVTPKSKIKPDALVTLSAVGSMAALVICVLATIAYRDNGLKKLGMTRARLLPGLGVGALAAIVVIPLVTTASLLTAALWDALGLNHPSEHDLLRILGDPNEQSLRNLILLSAVFIAPLSEELLFRGHVQTLLGRAFGAQNARSTVIARWGAVLVTSALFSAVHPWWTVPPIFVLALCLGYVYERTGNYWAAVTLHAIFNGTSTAIFLFQQGQPGS